MSQSPPHPHAHQRRPAVPGRAPPGSFSIEALTGLAGSRVRARNRLTVRYGDHLVSERQPLHPGQLLTGPLSSEPMRVETVRANGPDAWSQAPGRSQAVCLRQAGGSSKFR